MAFFKHLVENKDNFIKKERINIVRKRVGYSEHTQWDTTVSFDEVQTVDFDALLEEIDEFTKTFEKEEK